MPTLSLWWNPFNMRKRHASVPHQFLFFSSLLCDPLLNCLGDRANIQFIFGYLVFYISRSLLSYSPVYLHGLLLMLSLFSSPLSSSSFCLPLSVLLLWKARDSLLQKYMLVKKIILCNLFFKVSVL